MKNILWLIFVLLTACASGATEPETSSVTPVSQDMQFAGKYIGNYMGDDTGSLNLEIDDHGRVIWEGVSKAAGDFAVRGLITYTDDKWMLKGSTDAGATFQAFLQGDGLFAGSWEDPGAGSHGTFELRKLAE